MAKELLMTAIKKIIIPIALVIVFAVFAVSWQPLAVPMEKVADRVYLWANDLVRNPEDPPYYSLHYRLRTLFFSFDPSPNHPVVFLGDSITYGGDWSKLFPDSPVENRGIGGDTTLGLLNRLDQVIKLKPTEIFLMIGTNDLCYNRTRPEIIANYRRILERFRKELPNTKVYVENVLPFNDQLFPSRGLRKNDEIRKLNAELRQLAADFRDPYLDLATAFTGPDGRLPAEYTSDGLHLSEAGYILWRNKINGLVAVSSAR
jgi:lysophospholipase L1-like esterase